MSTDAKFLTRPKVRFSQADADELETNELNNKTDQRNTFLPNKPRIRSIVTLDKSIKLSILNPESSNEKNKDSQLINNAQKIEALTVCSNAFPSCTVEAFNHSDKTENQKPLSDINNIQNTEGNSKETDASKISKKSTNGTAVVSSVSSVVQNETLDKVPNSQNTIKANAAKKCMKVKKGKENEMLANKKYVKNIIKTTSDLKHSHHKTKSSLTTTNPKKANVISKLSNSASSKKINSKYTVTDVMPCNKYNKALSKAKSSSIKKTVIRDIIGPKIKPYVGPGASYKKEDSNVLETNESTRVKPCTAGDKLARPEYNSIMCTINKLNELKKQKVVTDIECLPASYQKVINEKISRALDFPFDEAIYKNLVDLSIDEKELPNRLTRSKDPESRQKDAVPVLSDFFTPVSPEEYCTPVSVKPRIQETTDSWSAFKISDKIFEWKHTLDNV